MDRYQVNLSREGQPSDQMAEMSMTLPGPMLLDIVSAVAEGKNAGSLASWLPVEKQGSFGKLKSLTIARVEEPNA